LDLGRDIAFSLASRVVEAAATCNNFVRIDMEGSQYTQTTIEMTRELFARTPHVGTVIQSYLYRSEGDVRLLSADGIRIRLVKGAYLEPESVAYPEKSDVDENYRRLAAILLTEGVYPAFATHDEQIIGWIIERARRDGIDRSRFEFQMLYGIRRDLQERLRGEGYNVRVYIPYGTEWYPYLMRRLAERPANVLFIVGSVAREARSR
jgi:proline dehydrogenase